MPCRWRDGGLGQFAGKVRFRRRFGYPGRIDAHERVWLMFEGAAGAAEAALNGQSLGKHERDGPFEFDVTALLQARNELVVELTAGADGGLWGEVALEVRCTAHLAEVRFRLEAGRLQASGKVVGTSDRPLELYLLQDNATAGYQTIEAGRPFCLTADRPCQNPTAVARIELVDGAVVWYQMEQVVEAPGG